LRILDSKEPEDQALIAAAPSIDSALGSAAGAFFEAVQKGLQAAGVAFVRQPRLVRGFDYYRHTAFEFVSDALGAQATVIGGGRYDGLIETMGGPATPAVGWAGGVERLMLLCAEPAAVAPELALIPLTPDLEPLAQTIAMRLRASGIGVELAFGGSEKKRFEKAKKAGIGRVLNLGPSPEGLAELRLRDLVREAQPVRARLVEALAAAFVVCDDDETRRITLAEQR
jgi:histidyl-tRNA synthetase